MSTVESMDFCVDCNRTLRDGYCRRCNTFYAYRYISDMACRDCSHRMIVPRSPEAKIRFKCDYCNLRYFFTEHYKDNTEELKEFLQSVERVCEECHGRVLINHFNGELVCQSCGLISEKPIVKI